jgi:hypothetical protein
MQSKSLFLPESVNKGPSLSVQISYNRTRSSYPPIYIQLANFFFADRRKVAETCGVALKPRTLPKPRKNFRRQRSARRGHVAGACATTTSNQGACTCTVYECDTTPVQEEKGGEIHGEEHAYPSLSSGSVRLFIPVGFLLFVPCATCIPRQHGTATQQPLRVVPPELPASGHMVHG